MPAAMRRRAVGAPTRNRRSTESSRVIAGSWVDPPKGSLDVLARQSPASLPLPLAKPKPVHCAPRNACLVASLCSGQGGLLLGFGFMGNAGLLVGNLEVLDD